MVEWLWQGKLEVLGQKPIQLPLYSPQISHGLVGDGTPVSSMGGWQLTVWDMTDGACKKEGRTDSYSIA
jgi:hypothetical protein